MFRSVVVFGLFVCLLVNITWADVTVKGVNYTSPMGAGDLPDMAVKRGSTDYTVYYKGSQMRMDSADGLSMIMRYRGAGVEFVMINHNKREFYPMQSTLASAAENITAAQAAASISGGMIDNNLNPEPRLGHETKGARFWLKGIAMPPNQALAQSAGGNAAMPSQYADMLTIKMDVDGIAIVAPGMPGADEIAGFYKKVEQSMAAGEAVFGMSSGVNPYLSRGLTMVMAKVAGFGMPLLVMQKTEIKFETQGLPPQVAAMMQSMMGNLTGSGGGAAQDVWMTEVVNVYTGAVDEGMFYDRSYPPGYKKVDPKKALKWK